MAAVTVTADNNRIEDCDDDTEAGFSSIGGGAGAAAEAPFAYQGTLLVNRKITSATGAGFYYDPTADGGGSAVDMTATRRRHWMVKIIVSDYGGLDATDGVRVRLGSGTSDYDVYVLAGSDSPLAVMASYRPVGGLLVFPVSANEATAYSDSGKSSGSPVLTAVDYFGAVFAFTTSSAKNENCGLDAIDIGSGLYLVGGDGADPDGVYQDFVDEDEGTTSNRWGYARVADGGGILAFGEWRIGTDDDTTSTATVFNDSQAVITWLDGMFEAGFSRIVADLGDAGTTITDGCLHIGAGNTTDVDTRPDYIFQGTSGTGLFNGQLRNFRNVTLTSAASIEDADVECALLTQATAEIKDSIIRTNALTSVACLQDPTFGTSSGLHDVTFIQTGAGHAIEIDSAGTYTLTNISFSGYGANTTDSAAIDVTASSGTVTINWSGGTEPTFKTAGATVIIQNSVNVSVTALDGTTAVEGARVHLLAAAGGPLAHELSTTITRSGSTATATATAHGLTAGQLVLIRGADQEEYNGIKTVDAVPTANTFEFTVSGTPTTPATGTIDSTGFIINDLTNASGLAENAGWPFSSNQPVRGVVRKGSASPTFQPASLLGTITSAGLSITAPMISDS